MSAEWTVTPTVTWLGSIREVLDGPDGVGTPLDYDGTIDGAWTYAGADLAHRVSQSIADGISASLLSTAPASVVVARALDRGLTPRPATSTVLTITMDAGTGGVLPLGSLLRVASGTVSIEDGEANVTVPLPRSQWSVVENLNAGGLVGIGDTIKVECTTAGRVSVSNPTSFEPVDNITGVTSLEWSNDAVTYGRAAERTSALRRRTEAARASIGGSAPGMLAALRELDWVVAAGNSPSPGDAAGYVRTTVTPAPPTTADQLELAETIYRHTPLGQLWLGANSQAITAADGQSVTILWDEGTVETVAVVFSVTPSDGVDQDAADALAREGIRAVFDLLAPGGTLLYLRVLGSLDQAEIAGGTVTLNGGTANITPSSATNVLTPSFS